MATNYTVVLFSRQHFGNQAGVFNDIEPGVAFVGRAKDFSFDCPGINTAEAAVLMFQSRDVDHQQNILRVNGVDVFGGLPASPARDAWNGNILLVERHHQLKATGNVLRVEARRADGGSDGDVDDFILDNIVIVYKTLDVVVQLPTAAGDLGAFLATELDTPSPTCGAPGRGRTPRISTTNTCCPRQASSRRGDWCFGACSRATVGQAHAQAKLISSTYNVVEFFDTPSDRIHYVLMEGIPGQIPARATQPAGEHDHRSRRSDAARVGHVRLCRATAPSAEHLGAAHQGRSRDREPGDRSVPGAGGAHAVDCRHRPRSESRRGAVRAVTVAPVQRGGRVAHGGVCLSNGVRGDLCERHLDMAPSVPRERDLHGGRVPEQRRSECPRYRPYTCGEHRDGVEGPAAGSGPVINARVFDSSGGCFARGTDNMQMRFASGRPHASICAEGNGPIGPSRFIHIEQRRPVRRAPTDADASPGVNRAVVLAGIVATFP